MEELKNVNSRRKFIGKLAASAALAGTYSFTNPLTSHAATPKLFGNDPEKWFKLAKGSHRIVYDASEPHQAMPLIWAWVFYHTNNLSGTPDNDMTGMVVLRHNAIPFALEDRLWQKYKLGEFFTITDNTTNQPALRNPYYVPKEGDYPFPGIDGIKRLQERGAMFCVCSMAILVYSGLIAKKYNMDAEEVKNDWMNGVLPNVQIVPSGVWAIGRAQENSFAYCYAGG